MISCDFIYYYAIKLKIYNSSPKIKIDFINVEKKIYQSRLVIQLILKWSFGIAG